MLPFMAFFLCFCSPDLLIVECWVKFGVNRFQRQPGPQAASGWSVAQHWQLIESYYLILHLSITKGKLRRHWQ